MDNNVQTSEVKATRGKVLVVDDDTIALKVTRDRLERAGYEVITRNEALGTSMIVAVEKPDVVLLDYKMPGMTGDVLARLLGNNPSTLQTAVIFHSGEDLSFLQERARNLRVIGAIAKTNNERIFLAQFERLFARACRKDPA